MAQDRRGSPPPQNAVRFGARTDLSVDVTLSGTGFTAVVGIIRNASISGALIETSLELPLNTDLVVAFDIGGETGEHLRLRARVVRLDAAGLGVEWSEMGTRDVVEMLQRASARR
jgi:hypothetical protein